MYYALNILNPHITTLGAPLLESLTLMRCNDFVSFSPRFRPQHLARPAFLQRKKKANAVTAPRVDVMPRLKHLTLKGVHVDWTALADAVDASRVGGLRSLSLGSHSAQVRPSGVAFRRLLGACPGLEVLSVCGSGPVSSSSSTTTAATDVDEGSSEKVRFGNLQKLVVGYRSVGEARKVFGSIAGVVRELVVEDVSNPVDDTEIEGNDALECLLSSDARQDEGLLLSQVQELSLRNVKLGARVSDRGTLRTVLDGATGLRKFKAEDVGVENVLTALQGCSCPKLESVAIKTGPMAFNPGALCAGVWFEMTKQMVKERALKAPSSLRQVKMSMELPHGSCGVAERVDAVVCGTLVGIEVREKARMCDVGDDEEDEAEAYLPGGTFNDPVFDACWASSPFVRGTREEQLPVKLG